MKKPDPENFPPPSVDEAETQPKEPEKPTTVGVAPAFARSGEPEDFATGESIWGKPAKKPDGEAEGDGPQKPKFHLPKVNFKVGSLKREMIVYPIKAIHNSAVDFTGYPGWAVTEEEAEYWGYLADFMMENFPLEYLIPVVMIGGLLVLEARKFVGYKQWQKNGGRRPGTHPETNPAAATPREAPGMPPGALGDGRILTPEEAAMEAI